MQNAAFQSYTSEKNKKHIISPIDKPPEHSSVSVCFVTGKPQENTGEILHYRSGKFRIPFKTFLISVCFFFFNSSVSIMENFVVVGLIVRKLLFTLSIIESAFDDDRFVCFVSFFWY